MSSQNNEFEIPFSQSRRGKKEEISVKAIGRRIGSAAASRLGNRPNLGGGRRRGARGLGMPDGDLNPRTRVDIDGDGTIFDGWPGWEQPDPTPSNPKLPGAPSLSSGKKDDGPSFPRKPTYGPFLGKAEERFGNAKTWEEFKEIYDDTEINFFDYETTGLVFDKFREPSANGQPVQFGVVRMKGDKEIARLNLFMNPKEPLGEWSARELKDKDGNQLTDQWLSGQMSMAEAHQALVEFAGEDAIFGVQNAAFDKDVLEQTLSDAGIDWRPGGYLDTKDIADMTLPKWSEENQDGPFVIDSEGNKKPSNGLAAITKYLEVELGEKHHTADADAQATGRVMSAIINGALERDWPTNLLDPEKRKSKLQKDNQRFDAEVKKFRTEKEAFIKAAKQNEQPSLSSGSKERPIIKINNEKKRPVISFQKNEREMLKKHRSTNYKYGDDSVLGGKINAYKGNWLKGLSSQQIADLIVPDSQDGHFRMWVDDIAPGAYEVEGPRAAFKKYYDEMMANSPWDEVDYSPDNVQASRDAVKALLDSSPAVKWAFENHGAPSIGVMSAKGIETYEAIPSVSQKLTALQNERFLAKKPFVRARLSPGTNLLIFNKRALIDREGSMPGEETPLLWSDAHMPLITDAHIDKSITGTMVHEWGHWLVFRAVKDTEQGKKNRTNFFGSGNLNDDNYLNALLLSEYYSKTERDNGLMDLWDKKVPIEDSKEVPRVLTSYGHVNPAETFAEGVVAYFHPNPEVRKNAINEKLRNDIETFLGDGDGKRPWDENESIELALSSGRTSKQRSAKREVNSATSEQVFSSSSEEDRELARLDYSIALSSGANIPASGSQKLNIVNDLDDRENDNFATPIRTISFREESGENKEYVIFATGPLGDNVYVFEKAKLDKYVSEKEEMLSLANGVPFEEVGISVISRMTQERDIRNKKNGLVGAMSVMTPSGEDSTSIVNEIAIDDKHKRRGLASALFKYQRDFWPDQDLHHSSALSDDGRAFAAATQFDGTSNPPVRNLQEDLSNFVNDLIEPLPDDVEDMPPSLSSGARVSPKERKKQLEKVNSATDYLRNLDLQIAEVDLIDPETGKQIQSPIFTVAGRPMALIDVNGIRIPFYQSTGKGGKANPVGKWYPIFGVGKSDLIFDQEYRRFVDRGGWFNKGDTFEVIENYYGLPEFERIATILNDIDDLTNIDFYNVGQPVPEDEVIELLKKNRSVIPSGQKLPVARESVNHDLWKIINRDLTPYSTVGHAERSGGRRWDYLNEVIDRIKANRANLDIDSVSIAVNMDELSVSGESNRIKNRDVQLTVKDKNGDAIRVSVESELKTRFDDTEEQNLTVRMRSNGMEVGVLHARTDTGGELGNRGKLTISDVLVPEDYHRRGHGKLMLALAEKYNIGSEKVNHSSKLSELGELFASGTSSPSLSSGAKKRDLPRGRKPTKQNISDGQKVLDKLKEQAIYHENDGYFEAGYSSGAAKASEQVLKAENRLAARSIVISLEDTYEKLKAYEQDYVDNGNHYYIAEAEGARDGATQTFRAMYGQVYTKIEYNALLKRQRDEDRKKAKQNAGDISLSSGAQPKINLSDDEKREIIRLASQRKDNFSRSVVAQYYKNNGQLSNRQWAALNRMTSRSALGLSSGMVSDEEILTRVAKSFERASLPEKPSTPVDQRLIYKMISEIKRKDGVPVSTKDFLDFLLETARMSEEKFSPHPGFNNLEEQILPIDSLAEVFKSLGHSRVEVAGSPTKKILGPVISELADLAGDEDFVQAARDYALPPLDVWSSAAAKSIVKMQELMNDLGESRREFMMREFRQESIDGVNSFVLRDKNDEIVMSAPIADMEARDRGSFQYSKLNTIIFSYHQATPGIPFMTLVKRHMFPNDPAEEILADSKVMSANGDAAMGGRNMAETLENAKLTPLSTYKFSDTPAGVRVREMFERAYTNVAHHDEFARRYAVRVRTLLLDAGLDPDSPDVKRALTVGWKQIPDTTEEPPENGGRFVSAALLVRNLVAGLYRPSWDMSGETYTTPHEFMHLITGQGFTRHGEMASNIGWLGAFGEDVWPQVANLLGAQQRFFELQVSDSADGDTTEGYNGFRSLVMNKLSDLIGRDALDKMWTDENGVLRYSKSDGLFDGFNWIDPLIPLEASDLGWGLKLGKAKEDNKLSLSSGGKSSRIVITREGYNQRLNQTFNFANQDEGQIEELKQEHIKKFGYSYTKIDKDGYDKNPKAVIEIFDDELAYNSLDDVMRKIGKGKEGQTKTKNTIRKILNQMQESAKAKDMEFELERGPDGFKYYLKKLDMSYIEKENNERLRLIEKYKSEGLTAVEAITRAYADMKNDERFSYGKRFLKTTEDGQ
jgi:DNA polymerase III epsilon subunit-like protein